MSKYFKLTGLMFLSIVALSSIILLGYLFPIDLPISTPDDVKQIVIREIPSTYEVKSVQSIQRISQFENENRPMKWLVLTLKNSIVASDKEMYEIAEPICRGLVRNNSGYEGLDIETQNTSHGGVDCSPWAP